MIKRTVPAKVPLTWPAHLAGLAEPHLSRARAEREGRLAAVAPERTRLARAVTEDVGEGCAQWLDFDWEAFDSYQAVGWHTVTLRLPHAATLGRRYVRRGEWMADPAADWQVEPKVLPDRAFRTLGEALAYALVAGE